MKQEIIDKINRLASQDEPFLFVINYQADEAFIRKLSDINPEECLFDFEGKGNFSHARKETWKEEISETTWQIEPPLYEDYEQSFNIVKSNIMAGNSYLTNLTNRVPVSCNLSLEEIFHRAKGKYKLLLRRKRTQAEDKAHLKEENIEENLTPFVCFSPETFVRIKGGRIYSYPMKGTLDASLPNAEKLLMEDRKDSVVNCTADTPMTAISATTQIATGSTNIRPLSQSLISCPRCPLTNLRSFSAQAWRVPLWNITPQSGNSSISIISIT